MLFRRKPKLGKVCKSERNVAVSTNPSRQHARYGVAGFDGKVEIEYKRMPGWMKEAAAARHN